MALPNAYSQYAEYNRNKIMTASAAELTLMLYEGAIKFNNIAISAIEKHDVEKAHTNIVKSQNIIDYLRETLNTDYPVAQDFERIYVYVRQRLVDANVKKDPAILEEINEHMRSLRDTWKEIMKASHAKGAM